MLDRRFFNINFIVIDVANEPNANPVTGDQFIIGRNASGDFSGIPYGTLARYDGDKWDFIIPRNGSLEVLNITTGEFLRYINGAWMRVAVFSGIEKTKNLIGLEITDNDTATYAVGELWDFSNVKVVAQYDDNTMAVVNAIFSEEGNTIAEDGEHTITVSYSEGGITVSGTFTRNTVGNDDFLQYVSYDISGDKIYVKALNLDNITTDNPEDIIIYSTCKHDETIYEVVIGD